MNGCFAGAFRRQPARTRAGGKQQPVVAKHRARRGDNGFPLPVDGSYKRSRMMPNVVLRIAGRTGENDLLGGLDTVEQLLREWRAVVRKTRLFRQQIDGRGRSTTREFDGRPMSGNASTDHHEALHFFSASKMRS